MAEGTTGGMCEAASLSAAIEALTTEVRSINLTQIHILRHHWEQLGRNDGVPRASLLVNEFYGWEDLDRNGLIYGRDFVIDPDCPDMPPMLDSLPPPDGVPQISWASYLTQMVDRDRAMTLIHEFHTGSDIDGDGQVYGKDFVIDPNCTQRPYILRPLPLPPGVRQISWPEYLVQLGG